MKETGIYWSVKGRLFPWYQEYSYIPFLFVLKYVIEFIRDDIKESKKGGKHD